MWALCFCACVELAVGLRQHRLDDLHDELLACPRQLGDALHLLLQLRCRAAFRGRLAVIGEQSFYGHAQALGDGW